MQASTSTNIERLPPNDEIVRIFDERGYLYVANQSLSPAEFLAIASLFGVPDVSVSTGTAVHILTPNAHKAACIWHKDRTFRDDPCTAIVLHAKEVPVAGGDTQFADLSQAYDELDANTKATIMNLNAIHDLVYFRERHLGELSLPNATIIGTPPTYSREAPLVITHPYNGRKCINIGGHVSRIVGLQEEESKELIQLLLDHCTQKPKIHTHKWRAGDLLIWDNIRFLHRTSPYNYAMEKRRVQRIVVAGKRLAP